LPWGGFALAAYSACHLERSPPEILPSLRSALLRSSRFFAFQNHRGVCTHFIKSEPWERHLAAVGHFLVLQSLSRLAAPAPFAQGSLSKVRTFGSSSGVQQLGLHSLKINKRGLKIQ
jgi:hypothetical protein